MGHFLLLAVAFLAFPAAAAAAVVPRFSSHKFAFPGPATAFTVPAAFPTTVYESYYVKPGPTNEPQPAVFDPVLNITFPFNLTNPETVPTNGSDPVLYPPALANLTDASAEALVSAAALEILAIIEANNTGLSSNCSKCVAALSVAQMAAQLAPTHLPAAMVSLCKTTGFKTGTVCQNTYGATNFGASWVQILAKADVVGLDGQYICASLSTDFCSQPPLVPVKVKFPKAKPVKPKKSRASGKRVKVLHLSDLHLDTRYMAGSEANCTSSMCCRYSAPGQGVDEAPATYPAPLFGYYKCDSPFYLALAALQSIGPLTGTSVDNPPALSLYTGDLVAHDSQNQRSRAYVEVTEDSVWQMFKAYIGGPIYAALGNHDTSPDNFDVAHAIDDNGPLGQQFSWNYDHVSKLWEHYGWIDGATQAQASVHYAAYSVLHPLGLRVITLNTDLYYRNNPYTFIHAADPDFSGMFSFLVQELQKAEDAGERVWIVGHVLSGWDGSNPMPGGSDMLYQIVDRYSPHVIANVFFGHTHEDQAFVYYKNNGTRRSAEDAIASAWVGPSITPLTNLNSGFRLYEVDTGSFEVFEAYTFYADVSTFNHLNETGAGPTFNFEYSTRAAYGPAAAWPDGAPLNATFWHRVTEAMEKDRTLATLFNTYQGKSSVRSPNCTSDACTAAKICYIRSGSAALGKQCPQGFGSVQGPYTGNNF
ncbi:Metallo-dependent phosphatase-like protein [Lasiosphaeria miniovina]|uniref:Metallo-dependent phosphatase-like protein n=1 Tax=Lasiosphaeria miniovina TaxID=1954250 RepID=A0AA40B5L8_9PEZI|nr:Metallo-dependent phosphatase-like protein [Lasiosphaeria miniovina]KAK0727952.1 Metallo-dependent phosphatase-like protein [Lasiosphaeria miniovina]